MKKFTLLIAMLFCILGYSQDKSTSPESLKGFYEATQGAPTKAAVSPNLPYASFSEVPEEVLIGRARNAAAFTKKQVASQKALPYKSVTSTPKSFMDGLASRKASSNAKKTIASQTRIAVNKLEDQSPKMQAVVNKFIALGSQTGRMSDYFTIEEAQLLRAFYGSRKIMSDVPAGPSNTLFTNSGKTGSEVINGFAGTATNTNGPNMMPVVITHSVTQNITPLNSVTCNAGGLPTNNLFFRSFDLANDFGIAGDFNVTDVEFAIEEVDGPIDITLNIYSTTSTFPTGYPGSLTLQGTAVASVNAGDALTVVSVPLTATIPAGETMIYEMNIPDQQTSGFVSFFPGSNADGQTDPSYIMAVDCGLATPATLASIGFPNQHMVMNVVGDEGGGGGGGSDLVYAHDVGFCTSGDIGTFDVAGPYTIDVLTNNTAANFAGDMDDDNNLFVINTDNPSLDSVDKVTGVNTVVANLTGLVGAQGVSGLSWDTVSATWYVLATDGAESTLYSLDPGTGALTVIGNTGLALGIWLAIDKNGNAYTADIGDDNLYSVDLATGAVTLIGPSGLNMNFAQDAGFDDDTDTLYAGAYTGGGTNQFCSVNTATGAFTPLGTVNADCAELGVVAIEATLGGGGGGGCTTGVYTDRASYDTEAGAGNFEDWGGGPGVISGCDAPFNSSGNSCFAPGEIEDGIEVLSSDMSQPDPVAYFPAGSGFTVDDAVGSNYFVDYTIINFPNNDVTNFGLDIYGIFGGGAFDVRIFGAGGLITTETVAVAGSTPTFFGYIADEIIVSVEIEDPTLVNAEFVAQIAFGECTGGGGGGGCTAGTFTDRGDFEAAFGGTLTNEGFSPAPAPGGIATCTEPINSGGGSCYAPGEIEDGIEIAARDLVDLVSIDAGVFGNPDIMVGPNTFTDALIINFPNDDVTAFGVDVLMPLNGAPTDVDVRVFGTGGLIATLTVTVTGNGTPVFIGYIAEETIVSVEMEDPLGGGELISLASFGLCEGGGGGGNDCSVSGPGNGFENGKSCTQNLGRIVAHDIDVPADQDLLLESIVPNVFIGATGSGVNASFVDIYIWGDNGGQPDPGNVIATVPGFVPTSQTVVGSNFGFDVWALELDHPDVTLGGQAGVDTKYWIGIAVEATDASNVFWENSTAGLIGAGEAYNDGTGFVIDSTLEGVYTFNATCEDLVIVTFDDCEGALPIECGDSILGSTLGSTPDSAPDCDTSTQTGVWYTFVDDTGLPGDYVLTTCSPNTDYDTKVSVYSGDCTNLICVAGNDDDPNCPNFQTTVEFSSDGATTYYILVHGFAGATGNFELSLECTLIPPPNDDIENAIDLDEVGCPFTDENVAMPAATEEGGTPTNCDITGAAGVWYVFTPELDGFITGTIGTPAGISSVTFYTAPDESSTEDELVLVDWWQNQCLPSESATIPVVAGQTYYCFVVNTGGVTDIIFDNCQLGVDSNEIEGFAFYPNPTNDRINLSSVQNIEKVTLYNILGQKLIDLNVDATSTELNVSNLATGAYLMEVTVDGQKGTYKVIKR